MDHVECNIRGKPFNFVIGPHAESEWFGVDPHAGGCEFAQVNGVVDGADMVSGAMSGYEYAVAL